MSLTSPSIRTVDALAHFLGLESKYPLLTFSGVTSNSSFVTLGDVFFALPGTHSHGASFAEEAISSGAVAIVTDQAGAALISGEIPVMVVADPRAEVADCASWFHARPSSGMFGVAVTGTNGKTTTASILFQLWQLANRRAGFIGTLGIKINEEHFPIYFTTPEAPQLQETLARMRDQGVTHFTMEVSSHALIQKRVIGTKFMVSAFTNLTQDHLDFHGDLESYFLAKAKLFTPEYSDLALINIDNQWGEKLIENVSIPFKKISRLNSKAEWYYSSAVSIAGGYEVIIRGTGGILIEGVIPLIGDYNLDNALLAIALAVESGLDPLAIAQQLKNLTGVPGRLEKIDCGQPFLALVDFAHTPDAVERALSAAREVTSGKLIAVLGCGGNRDSTKRARMGEKLVAGSDLAIFTSDNPRNESATHILKEMLGDYLESESLIVEEDRRGAIANAVSEAKAGDTVILLGKGHEEGQEILGVKYPFDDRVELGEAIRRLQ